MQKTTIVLAMHGTPPKDFPQPEVIELFSLHARIEQASPNLPASQVEQWQQRYHELDEKVRHWPRTPENDPFYAASQQIATLLSAEINCKVLLGFNEFCAPDLDTALDQAATISGRVIVVTPMMTPGGEHSEQDIPAAIRQAQAKYPQVDFRYAWPFDLQETAQFLAQQINKVNS